MRAIPKPSALLALLLAAPAAAAEISGGVIKVGLLLDMDSIYADLAGRGSVVAARLAAEAVGGAINGHPIELLVEDHDNDPAQAAAIARRWLAAEGVDVIADVVGTPPALAVQEVNRDHQAVIIYNAVVSTAVTNEACAPTSFHWMFDAYAYTRVSGEVITALGKKTWYTLTVDNAYGNNFLANLKPAVEANGGRIIGGAKHPLGTRRFIRYLLDAEASGAEVIALGSAGDDLANAVKQAFDLRKVSRGDVVLTAPGMALASTHNVGLALSQGMLLPESFYWDLDERSRAWSKLFHGQAGRMPTEPQAGVYSGLSHYFKAVAAAGSDHGPTVAAKMRELPVDDPIVRNAYLREDGRLVHDMYLVRVKSPTDSRGPWDYFEILKVIPGEQAFQPLSQSRCPAVAGRAPRSAPVSPPTEPRLDARQWRN